MKTHKLLLHSFIVFCISLANIPLRADDQIIPAYTTSQTENATKATKGIADWTVLAYIAADNSLAEFADMNIKDMSAGLARGSNVNILVQWDQPENNKTWRYKVLPNGRIDAGSLSAEMGYNPEKELIDSMKWATSNYPANHYAVDLWDHGSGVEDLEPATARNILKRHLNTHSWIQLPGHRHATKISKTRGILYDDTQGTCLTNQGLSNAMSAMKGMIGKKVDFVCMDACLMAMVEIAYQMKDSVETFVGSQQTIPGEGYPYTDFISALSQRSGDMTGKQLASTVISAYQNLYTRKNPTPDFTLSAIDVTSINLLKDSINTFIAAVDACSKADAAQTKKMIITARKASTQFEMAEYIDLHSFYAGILGQIKKSSPKSYAILPKDPAKDYRLASPAYQKALSVLSSVIQDGINQIQTVVFQSASGSVFPGIKGLSIYYPKSGSLHSSYAKTLFAQDTNWSKFIKTYR